MIKKAQARLAQSAERKALNLVVVGSSPTVGVLTSKFVTVLDSVTFLFFVFVISFVTVFCSVASLECTQRCARATLLRQQEVRETILDEQANFSSAKSTTPNFFSNSNCQLRRVTMPDDDDDDDELCSISSRVRLSTTFDIEDRRDGRTSAPAAEKKIRRLIDAVHFKSKIALCCPNSSVACKVTWELSSDNNNFEKCLNPKTQKSSTPQTQKASTLQPQT